MQGIPYHLIASTNSMAKMTGYLSRRAKVIDRNQAVRPIFTAGINRPSRSEADMSQLAEPEGRSRASNPKKRRKFHGGRIQSTAGIYETCS